jgi:ankyrin repeat protein
LPCKRFIGRSILFSEKTKRDNIYFVSRMHDQANSRLGREGPLESDNHSEEEVTVSESYEEEIIEEVLEEHMVDGDEHFEELLFEVMDAEWEEQPEFQDQAGEGETRQQQDRDGDFKEHMVDGDEQFFEVFEEGTDEFLEVFEEDADELLEAVWEEEPEFKDYGGEGEETQQHQDGDAEEQQNGHFNDDEQQQQQQQQQQQKAPAEERQLSRVPSAQELELLPYEITILHDLLKESDWKQLLSILASLRNQDPAIIEAALSTLDERNSTPMHIAVWKAPTPLVKLLMSVVPFDVRELILLKPDIDGNTPLHLACANMELKSDGTLDMSMLGILMKNAPNAHETVNWQGDTPLHLLLTSPAFRADPQNFQAEAYAEEMVKSTLENHIHLASALNHSGATLLHVACAHGAHERVLMILLELAPKSAEIVDNEGMLPLHYVAACISGKCTPAIFAEKLVEANEEAVIHPCNTGDTPLHFFVSNAKKNIDKHERNSRNTAKVVEALLGPGDFESMCPLLIKNKDSVSTR